MSKDFFSYLFIFYLFDCDNSLIGLGVCSDGKIATFVSCYYFIHSQPVLSVNQIHVNGFYPDHLNIDSVLLHTPNILQVTFTWVC